VRLKKVVLAFAVPPGVQYSDIVFGRELGFVSEGGSISRSWRSQAAVSLFGKLPTSARMRAKGVSIAEPAPAAVVAALKQDAVAPIAAWKAKCPSRRPRSSTGRFGNKWRFLQHLHAAHV
jgi:hypothetical protein